MISSFTGNYRFLSNFYPSPVTFEGRTYPTVEHAYQAAKTLDDHQRAVIAAAPTPGQAKRLGRAVQLRPDWEDVKLIVMYRLITEKFKNPVLVAKLRATNGQELVEGNYWNDTFWGVCRGKGKNHLGRLLMEARSNLTP